MADQTFEIGDTVLSPGGFPMTVVTPPRKDMRRADVTYCRSIGGGVMAMDTERLKLLGPPPAENQEDNDG